MSLTFPLRMGWETGGGAPVRFACRQVPNRPQTGVADPWPRLHHESRPALGQVTSLSGSPEASLVSFLVKRGFCPRTQQALLGVHPREVSV